LKKIKKLIKKMNNRGSSVIMVIASIGFVAIIVGALLSAAAYAYRLKITNKNAKDNFYYVEQAMQEIYAGVGGKTVESLYDAYTYTLENLVYYDLSQDQYVTRDNDAANEMFRKRFIYEVNQQPYFNQSDEQLAESLGNFITNGTVQIDKDALYRDQNVTDSIIIRNITLTREVEYKNNTGSGTYTQTVSADIEITQPDFDVDFENSNTDTTALFGYAMIADMGIEVESDVTGTVNITGNIYAAADYYNKSYNDSDNEDLTRTYTYGDSEYTMSAVSSKTYDNNSTTGLYNKKASEGLTDSSKFYWYDGENENSMYSGLLIKNTDVAISADTIIVPGTIAILDDSDVSIYNKASGKLGAAEIWTDNLVLGGTGESTDTKKSDYKSPTAFVIADMYVRDDTELNAEHSSLELKGSYYGYGNSTEKDTRVFVPTVDTQNFQIAVAKTDEDGNVVKEDGKTVYEYVNRDHYNSSAIVINGENTVLNLSKTSVLYLAGRAYIELSKDVSYGTEYVDADGNLVDKDGSNVTTLTTESYSYNPGIKVNGTVADDAYISDYKTGESISVKSTQVAYIPVTLTGGVKSVNINGKAYTCTQLYTANIDTGFFKAFFPSTIFTDGYVPAISQSVNGRTYYYYDLDTAYEILDAAGKGTYNADGIEYKSADSYSAAFITAYFAAAKETDESGLKLNEILESEAFTAGNIELSGTKNDGSESTIYSSGAITTKSDTAFSMILKNDTLSLDTSELWDSLVNDDASSTVTVTKENAITSALKFSSTISTEYSYVKWNLGHFSDTEADAKSDFDKMLSDGLTDDMITPINRYLNFSKIDAIGTISPQNFELNSGYKVWISDEDVVVGDDTKDYCTTVSGGVETTTTIVKGMIITKGDVRFNSKVTRFEGLIIAGGKIYVGGNLKTIVSSSEICRSIIKECLKTTNDSSVAKMRENVRSIFKQYDTDGNKCPNCGENLETVVSDDVEMLACPHNCDECKVTPCAFNMSADVLLVDVANIDYPDVCSIDNWTKTVE
jgi:hypothetical protein